MTSNWLVFQATITNLPQILQHSHKAHHQIHVASHSPCISLHTSLLELYPLVPICKDHFVGMLRITVPDALSSVPALLDSVASSLIYALFQWRIQSCKFLRKTIWEISTRNINYFCSSAWLVIWLHVEYSLEFCRFYSHIVNCWKSFCWLMPFGFLILYMWSFYLSP